MEPMTVSVCSNAVLEVRNEGQEGNFGGRIVSFFSELGGLLHRLALRISDAAARVFDSTMSMQHTVQFAMFSVMGMQIGRSAISGVGTKMVASFEEVDRFVDLTGLLRHGPYIFKEGIDDVKKGRGFHFAGMASLIIADICTIADWFAKVGAYSLSKVAEGIGKIRAFSFVNELCLVTFIQATAVVGLSFLAADAVMSLVRGEEMTKSLFSLAHCVAEVALNAFCVAGLSNPVGHVALGLLAAGTGVAYYLYMDYHPAVSTEVKTMCC